MRHPSWKLILISSVVFSLPGCMVGPNYKKPETKVNEQWQESKETTSSTEPWVEWWKAFEDPVLDNLVTKALEKNPDVHRAYAKIKDNKLEYFNYKSLFLPQVELIENLDRVKIGSNYPYTPTQSVYTDHRRTLYSFWEADLFGRIKRLTEGSHAQYQSTIENFRFVLISLIGEITHNYIDYRFYQQKIALYEQMLQIHQELTAMLEAKSKEGTVDTSAVVNSQFEIDHALYQISLLKEARQRSLNHLTFLAGELPGALIQDLASIQSIPLAPLDVPVGLPSTLLCRRPDIREAERKMAEAHAHIGVAIASLFPDFSLTGVLGRVSTNLARFIKMQDTNYFYGGDYVWPIFQGGRLINNIKISKARYEEAFFSYSKSVLQALSEVENALVSFNAEKERKAILEKEKEGKLFLHSQSTLRQIEGQTSYADTLKSTLDVINSDLRLVESKANLSKDFISLYKALGGGWETISTETSSN